jgi:hypothetical protein
MTAILDRHSIPSWQNGFARGPDESLYPDLWREYACCYCHLGLHKNNAEDLVRHNKKATKIIPGFTNGLVDPKVGIAMPTNPSGGGTYYEEDDGVYQDWSGRNLTILVRFRMTNWGDSSDTSFATVRTGGNSTEQFSIRHDGNFLKFQVRQSNDTTRTAATGDCSSLVGWHTIICAWTNSVNVRIFVPGFDENNTSASVGMQVVNTPINLGRRAGATLSIPDGALSVFEVWRRLLSDNDLLLLHEHPLAPLALKPSVIPLAAGGGGGGGGVPIHQSVVSIL